jgi:hypothetical protein
MIIDGRYAVPADKGLTPGRYKVVIFAPKEGTGTLPAGAMPGDPIPPAEESIPPQYNTQSDKFIEVTAGGTSQFDFAIQAKK